MKIFAVLTLIALPLVAMAGISSAERQSLCSAASHNNALAPLMDKWIAEGKFTYRDTGLMLSLDCPKADNFLLGIMIEEKRSENLEYAVIDLGLDVDAPVISHNGKYFSISQYLAKVAGNKNSGAAEFAASYLHNFHDPRFNPNLAMKVSMN